MVSEIFVVKRTNRDQAVPEMSTFFGCFENKDQRSLVPVYPGRQEGYREASR